MHSNDPKWQKSTKNAKPGGKAYQRPSPRLPQKPLLSSCLAKSQVLSPNIWPVLEEAEDKGAPLNEAMTGRKSARGPAPLRK